MIPHNDITRFKLKAAIKYGIIQLGGNRKLKIYGRLNCHSGERMKRENRVFFEDEEEAILAGFRPCGQCFRNKYNAWKSGLI